MRNTGTRSRMRPNPALLAVFWFGIQMVWGALLGVSLQARTAQLAPHGGLAAYGTLAAVGAAAAAVTQIGIGLAADRRRLRGSRRLEFYLTGAAGGALALFWFFSAPTLGQLFAAFVAVQVAMNAAIGPYQAVIPDFVPSVRMGSAASWMAALQSLGNASGALTAGLIGSARIVALMLAAALLTSCVVTATHVSRLWPVARPEPLARAPRAFVDLFISRALVYAGFYTLLGYLYFYIARATGGNVKAQTGIILLIFTCGGAIGAAFAGGPVNRIDRRGGATIGGGLFIAGLAAFLGAHGFAAFAASALLAGIAWGVFLTADWALGCALLPQSALATAMGVWNVALLLPQMIAPLLTTAILRELHALQSAAAGRIAFVVAIAEVAIGIAWTWRLPAFSVSVETVRAGNTP